MNIRRWTCALTAAVLTLCLLPLPALAAEDTPSRAQAAQTAAELAAQYGGAVSLQYALWEEGEITLSGQTGVYSKTEDRVLTQDNLYGVGSVSKIYTAAAVMQLVEEGKIDLDAPVTQYLPDFTMEDPHYRDITVRMLLNHSSGLMGSSFSDTLLLDDPEETAATGDLLARLATQRLKADPGAYSVYCNDGFTLAQLVVEAVSGQAFADYLHQNLLQPAGLEDTYTPSDDFDRDLLAKTYLGEDTRALPPETLNAVGTGGIYATAADLAAFGGALCGEGLLTQASLDAMAADESVRGMWPAGEDDALAYGLGWDSVRMYPFHSSGVQALVKGGDTQLYHGGLIVLPEYDMAVAVLSSGGSSLYNQAAGARILMDALAERGVEVADDGALPQAQPADMPADAQAYAGRYGDSMGVARVEVADDHLTLTLPALLGGASLDLFPYSDGTFRDETNAVALYFEEGENGRTYLLQRGYTALPGLVSVATDNYIYEQLSDNPVSPQVQGAWEERTDRLYLLLNEKYTSQLYPTSSVFSGVPEVTEGYVGSSRMDSADTARAWVQLPGTAGRDLSDMLFLSQKGVEYLFYGDYLFMDSAAAQTLYTGAGAYSTIGSDGYARWYQVADTATLQVDIEGEGGFCVYGADFSLKAASWAYGDTTADLAPGDWLVFSGTPSTRFHLLFLGKKK